MPSFSRILRAALEKQGLSQREFARRIGITPSTVNQAVRGLHVPRWTRGAVWAAALGLNGAAEREFIEELALAGAPPPVRRLVGRLRRGR